MEDILSWTFFNEIETPETINEILIDGEESISAFKTFRDVAAFTNKRLIVMDSQGLTGKKKELYSVPFKSVLMWSTENAGSIDFNEEVTLWTRQGKIKINLKRGIDVRQFDRFLAEVCL